MGGIPLSGLVIAMVMALINQAESQGCAILLTVS
jgi:hypothetical protein